ncbi:MAG TPA: hypothetical protein VI198_03670, partial [Candidatus Eisenbacteria bacterium]
LARARSSTGCAETKEAALAAGIRIMADSAVGLAPAERSFGFFAAAATGFAFLTRLAAGFVARFVAGFVADSALGFSAGGDAIFGTAAGGSLFVAASGSGAAAGAVIAASSAGVLDTGAPPSVAREAAGGSEGFGEGSAAAAVVSGARA